MSQIEFPEIDHPGYAAAVEAYERVRAEHRETNATLERLRGVRRAERDYPDGSPRFLDGDLAAAIQADDDDRARARIEGTKDPGQKRAVKLRREITATVDRLLILAQDVEQAEDGVRIVLRDDRAEIEAAVDAA
ncbi:MAG: hypothetical protein ACRDG9_01880, partial [Actinomycetota bacterium]